MEKIFNLMFELGWAIRNFLTKERGNTVNVNQFDPMQEDFFESSRRSSDDMCYYYNNNGHSE